MSKRFHASPKGMLAVLACLALLCSLFAFSLTVLADPAGDYTPSRYLKISNTDNAQPFLELKLPSSQYAVADGPYTLSMKLKTENITGETPNVEVRNGFSDLETTLGANTEGYVDCEYTIEGTDLGDAIRIGFFFTYGDLYIADLVIKDKNDAVNVFPGLGRYSDGMTEFAKRRLGALLCTHRWNGHLYGARRY